MLRGEAGDSIAADACDLGATPRRPSPASRGFPGAWSAGVLSFDPRDAAMADDADDDEERALARRDETGLAGADAYEREYMKGEGLVLYRDKQRSPWQMTALLGGIGIVSLLPVIAGAAGAWISAAITLPMLFLIWVLMGVLRETVSQGTVDVQYGLFGPKIPIAAIEAVAPTEYKWTTVGGWGIRRGPGGSWVYNMPGDGGRAVRIEWKDAKGKRKVTLIGSKHHLELAKTIERARRALPGGASRGELPASGDDEA